MDILEDPCNLIGSPVRNMVNFEEVVKTKEQFLAQPIWHNSLIRIENKPVFDKKLFSLGISKVKDFVEEQHNFLSHTDFIENYNCQLQPLKYFGLVSSLKQVKNSSNAQNPTLSIPQDSLLTLFLKNAKGTKVVYKKRVRKKKHVHPGERSSEMEHYGLSGGMCC